MHRLLRRAAAIGTLAVALVDLDIAPAHALAVGDGKYVATVKITPGLMLTGNGTQVYELTQVAAVGGQHPRRPAVGFVQPGGDAVGGDPGRPPDDLFGDGGRFEIRAGHRGRASGADDRGLRERAVTAAALASSWYVGL